MGQHDIPCLLITGAMSVISAAIRFGVRKGIWLAKMLERKPKLPVAVTLANRMARGIWAMLTKQEIYRDPEVMAEARFAQHLALVPGTVEEVDE